MVRHPFEHFLEVFVPQVAKKSRQLNKAVWILETTGNADAADLRAEIDEELRLLYNDRKIYEQLLKWDQDVSLKDPLLKRQLNILIRSFKQNMLPPELLEEIVKKESSLAQDYANFRPEVGGKSFTENEILEVLKKETDPGRRKKIWEASKEVGQALAPKILELVRLRNKAARQAGYSDFFQMQLELQEVDGKWLKNIFDDLSKRSDEAYSKIIGEIEEKQSKMYHVKKEDLGPWAWTDPFGQEDPLDRSDLDSLVKDIDISLASQNFYRKMGLDVLPILERSDMYERPGKNQHAFCMNIDRENDVRTLNNVQHTIKWMETVLHELGHAVYDLGFDRKLPWLLREPPHTMPTEAMALIAGRQAYRYDSLSLLVGHSEKKEPLLKKADSSLRRRQLIFSRWVLVMTFFESELYRDPEQDLNSLWWSAVKKYQKIHPPAGREGKSDWAAKMHIGLAPVYYFSYLLGELFASEIEEILKKKTGSASLTSEKAGQFLQQKLFFPGNSMSWSQLVEHVTGHSLSPDAWIRQFAR